MPGRRGHFEQARGNLDFAQRVLAGNPDPIALQWATTAVFYAALHALEGHFATFGLHNPTHAARRVVVANPRYRVPVQVRRAYNRLEVRSEGGRYLLRQFTADEVQALIDRELILIMRFVNLT